MRRGLVLVGILLLATLPAMGQGFDRAEFVAWVRELFLPIEDAFLIPEMDAFDYDAAVLFSGVPNGSQEHVVVVPLTSDSHSVYVATHLGEDLAWLDVGKLNLFGVLVMEPTDCISGLVHGVPYLARGVSWTHAEIVDASDVFQRYFLTWWHRGDPRPAYFKFSGNMEIHLDSCFTASSNQW